MLSILAKRGLTTAVTSISSGPLGLFVALAGLGFTLYEISSLLDESLKEDEKTLPEVLPESPVTPTPTPEPTPATTSTAPTPAPAPTKSSASPTPNNPSFASGFNLLNRVMDKEGIQDEETRIRIRRLAMIESAMNPNAKGQSLILVCTKVIVPTAFYKLCQRQQKNLVFLDQTSMIQKKQQQLEFVISRKIYRDSMAIWMQLL